MEDPNQRRHAWSSSLKEMLDRNPELRIIDDPEKLDYYRQDLNVDLPPMMRDLLLKSRPDRVFQPSTEAHLLDILALARKHQVPVTLRGAGTWGYGGAVPVRGGFVIDLGRMNGLRAEPERFQVTVGPGVRFIDIEQELDPLGQTLLTLPSGKGGTVMGWISTGGMGLGTFRHGPIRDQILELRVITPGGETLDLKAGDPEIDFYLSTEGQMGIIVGATLRTGAKPGRWYPFVISFDTPAEAYAFARTVAAEAPVRPDDVILFHPDLLAVLASRSDGKLLLPYGHLALVTFRDEAAAEPFRKYLSEKGLHCADEEMAHRLWEDRFLPMSIKPLGPSLLAGEVVLPVDQAAAYLARISTWGKQLGLTLYSTSHLINPGEVLFLAMVATDHRKAIFYADLLLVPMMVRLATQQFGGRPYGVGIWNTPFLNDLFPKERLKELERYKKKADPQGILNPGKFFNFSGRLGALQKVLFQPGVFDAGMTAGQWLLFRLFSLVPEKTLRKRVPIAATGLSEIEGNILSCAQCGACVSRCPVYRATGDETFTARGKLLTLKKAFETKRIELAKVLPLYFCIHCGRCDDECQVHLSHRTLFDKLEEHLSAFLPFPIEEVKGFIRQVEDSPDFQRYLDVVRTGFDQKIREQRNTFSKYRVTIDEDLCIHCGTCVDACLYGVRRRLDSDPRKVVVENEALCRGCGACIERCPQIHAGKLATTVELHPDTLDMSDPYWTAEVVFQVDLEATTGKVPVSGTGQGAAHRGFGNDGIRFGHFHIVGPAQNLLYESTEDAIAVNLGRRPKVLAFEGEEILTPAPRLIPLRTPVLLDSLPLPGGEKLVEAMIGAARKTGTRATLSLTDIERFAGKLGGKEKVFVPRITGADLKNLLTWKSLPEVVKAADLVEIEITLADAARFGEIRELFPEPALLTAVVTVTRDDVAPGPVAAPDFEQLLEALLDSPFDVLCFTSEYDPAMGYYPTTEAIPAVHRFLVGRKVRHRFSIVAAGGIRSAADAQKTIQRGANAIKIDWPVLLAADPLARSRFHRDEPLRIDHEPEALETRLVHLVKVWNVQITEVLGASGFKDIKKTVGEENRLVIFDDLEERLYDIFKDPRRIERNIRTNAGRIEREFNMANVGWRYSQLREMIQPAGLPHRFYESALPEACHRIFDRDHVWPASLIASVGRMASGDPRSLLLANTQERGNLGDGFDAMGVRFKENPDTVAEERLDRIFTALQLSPALHLKAPFLGAGMSVGSVGPGTWRARVMATRALGTQMDTGEGGYPTVFLLDEKWLPLNVSERHVVVLSRIMKERKLTRVDEVVKRLKARAADFPECDEVAEALKAYPAEMRIQYVPVVTTEDQPYVSTQLKTGLFGVTKETIRRARRVVIAFSQGAKQGVGGHLLGRKVFGLVSLLRGVPEGVSLISPFPFHNCYSIEDVKAFIDAVRMINRRASIAIKVAPSPDIEFIVSGLARIAQDNGMTIEIWLDGPRGGTGAAPDIIKGQMGMHMEYAIPICHEKLVNDGLRDHVTFMGSGGFRTWGDIVKGVALGLDGFILGTADLVAIGCVRDRNCESGCRCGIATIEPRMQILRNVETNARQVINFRAALQAQVTRAIAALGLKDIRELRGRYDLIEWPVLEERVVSRRAKREAAVKEFPATVPASPIPVPAILPVSDPAHVPQVPADCGVAAVVSNRFIPSHVMNLMLDRMANRGMDGVGIWKGGCYPDHLDDYALQVLVKGISQETIEAEHLAGDLSLSPNRMRQRAREKVLSARRQIVRSVMDSYFGGLDLSGFDGDLERCRIPYRRDREGRERDFRCFGDRDPGDVFTFFARVKPEALRRFIVEDLLSDSIWPPRQMRYSDLTAENFDGNGEFLREAEDEYLYRLSRRITRECYVEGGRKKVAVVSCGKHSGCWKTDGRDIPWDLPDAPVNVIHRRLATGSVVDQMNSHPFAELHTALTHNGETTNYRTMLNRVTQFNLTPLAQTDTAVASLKLHLLSQYLQYPFDALVESFSPTTGWKLTQVAPEVAERFRRVQEVELESAPDGPYQYLCGRIDPYRRVIERLDIIDPSLLRPNVAMLYDDGESFVSIVCSEKQGCDGGMEELHRLGLIRSPVPGLTFTVGTGMVSRIFYDETGRITGHEVLDKAGRPYEIPRGTLPAREVSHPWAEPVPVPTDSLEDLVSCFREGLPGWSYPELDAVLEKVTEALPASKAVEALTRVWDYFPGWGTGGKDRGMLGHLLSVKLNAVLDRLPPPRKAENGMVRVTVAEAGRLDRPLHAGQVLAVDARGFKPEGIDPLKVLGCFLDFAHQLGWRRYVVYRTEGQRGIGMGIGSGPTPETEFDVYGSPGEYCGAFNMGALIRVHSHCQNFTGMVMHSGELQIHGDVGKVTGYAAKGGTFNILGNVVDRGWVNAVSDPRSQGLEVNIVGTAFEHLCQALMGGSVIMLGLARGADGALRRLPSPYSGSKILAGASAGEVIFYDPAGRLEEAQYRGGAARPVEGKKWEEIVSRLLRLESIFGLGFSKDGKNQLRATIDGQAVTMGPEAFRWIIPAGGLEGYH